MTFEKQIQISEQRNDQATKKKKKKKEEIELFSLKAVKELKNLNFKVKQAIIRNIVEKVEANQKELIVSGYIPLEHLNYVEYKTSHRNCGAP